MMKVASALVILVLAGAIAQGEDKKPATEPVTWSTTMPAIELSHQPLEKVLGEMKAKLPGFDFSISRENVPHDQPVLPAMTVENVTLAQFASLLTEEIPGLRINEQSGGGGRQSLFQQSNSAGDATFWHIDVTPIPKLQYEPIVRLFSLSDSIPEPAILKGNADIDKQGINDALSLIQAALDVDGETPAATLKVHAPTQTLIFKGTPAQADIVANAIAVLQASAKSRSFAVDLKPSADFAKLKPATTQSSK
jgi:hypothetical protein